MLSKSQRISAAEWLVMDFIWAKGPVPASEVVEAMERRKGWRSRTTRTLLDRLVKKKALKIRAGVRPGLYEPRVTREECQRQESQSLLQRVFGGEPAAMLLHLVGEAKLSREDIRKLKAVLSEKEK